MAYIDVGKIENIRFMCHKVLPLVYDESLSYYEVLCKVANKLNESIEATNQLDDNVDNLNDRVNTISTTVARMAEELNTFEANMTASFNRLEAEITETVDSKMREVDNKIGVMDNKIIQIDNEVDALRNYVNASIERLTVETQKLVNDAIAELNNRFDKSQDEMRIYIYNTLQSAIKELPNITSVMVINPVYHTVTTIQQAIDDLFDNTRYFALTCDEFNSLGLSIDELNTLNARSIPRGYTVIEWLTYARRWLKINREHKAFMPNNGELKDYHNVLEFNTDMFRQVGALNMTELEDIGLTFNEFVELGLTIEDLAWRSNRLLA